MKPTERFFEANFYSQVARAWYPSSLVWFTPSTVDESEHGFDTFADLGGRFFFFQFKHPKHWRVRKRLCGQHNYLQAEADHAQLTTFRAAADSWPLGTFHYVMPGLLDWDDYATAGVGNLLYNTYYWDVLAIPLGFAAPTTSGGTPRKSNDHYLNLDPACPRFAIRSEQVDLPALRFSALVQQRLEYWTTDDSPVPVLQSAGGFRDFVGGLPSQTMGLLVSPQ